MSTHHDDIPFDIQTEIIKRIPDVKSLIRFRSVSKPWKSLINSSKFIAAYKSTIHHVLVSYIPPSIPACGYVSVADDDDSFSQHNFRLPPESVEPMYATLEPMSARLIGSSQGLFCFYGMERNLDNSRKDKYVAVVWNPSIKKSVTVHVPKLSYIGFGVCPRTCDPKLVNIKPTYDWLTYRNLSTSADIFTLSSGAWRSQSINLPNISAISFNIIPLFDFRVVIDGILYWHGTTDHYRYNQIITFDLTSEEFGEVCLPDRLAAHKNFSISKLNESLVALEYDGESQVCDVWMMEHGAFKKLFTIMLPFVYIIKGFRMNGQAIIERTTEKNGILKVYDPCTRHINDHDLRIDHHLFFKCSYTETLLLLDRQSDDGHMARYLTC